MFYGRYLPSSHLGISNFLLFYHEGIRLQLVFIPGELAPSWLSLLHIVEAIFTIIVV